MNSIDDFNDFKTVNKALKILGFSEGEIAVSLYLVKGYLTHRLISVL